MSVWQFGNADLVILAKICECQIFGIFTNVFCCQCKCGNVAILDLGIPAKWLAPVNDGFLNARILIFSSRCFAASAEKWLAAVNAGFLIFSTRCFATSVIFKFDNAEFGNSGKVTCHWWASRHSVCPKTPYPTICDFVRLRSHWHWHCTHSLTLSIALTRTGIALTRLHSASRSLACTRTRTSSGSHSHNYV